MMDGDLISRSKAKEELLSWAIVINKPDLLSREDALTVLDMIPAVEAVPVVRCKDCKHYRYDVGDGCLYCCQNDRYTDLNDFCSRGERKDNETD